jgi:hypothetical protein
MCIEEIAVFGSSNIKIEETNKILTQRKPKKCLDYK